MFNLEGFLGQKNRESVFVEKNYAKLQKNLDFFNAFSTTKGVSRNFFFFFFVHSIWRRLKAEGIQKKLNYLGIKKLMQRWHGDLVVYLPEGKKKKNRLLQERGVSLEGLVEATPGLGSVEGLRVWWKQPRVQDLLRV